MYTLVWEWTLISQWWSQSILALIRCKFWLIIWAANWQFPFYIHRPPPESDQTKNGRFCPCWKRIDRRLAGCSTLLSYGDKMILIKCVFSSLPTFFMSTLTISVGVLEQINKYLRHCFWRKYGLEDKGSALIAWDKVCLPKDQGGLGVLDLATQNKCLLVKHLHKFFNCENLPLVKFIWDSYYFEGLVTDIPVGSFWWKRISKLIPEFKKMPRGIIGRGNTIMLWHDNWGNGNLKGHFLELYSFTLNQNNII